MSLLLTMAIAIGAIAPAVAQEPGQPDPQMQAVLDAIASLESPPLPTLSPFNARNTPGIPYWLETAAAMQGKNIAPEPVADISHVLIPREGGEILARVYTPSGTGPFPVIVYYHGGGWVISNLDGYDNSARALTNAAGAIVVSVAYRQAPENPYPAAADDAFTAYCWVVENAASLGGDSSQVAVAGESAGGNLATVTAMKARDWGFQMPVHQLLVYPVTNYAFDTESYQTYANAVPLDKASMMWFWGHYLANEEDGDHPYASPLRAEDLSGMPATTVILAEIDPLQSEGMAYAHRLMDAGVPTTLHLYEGVTHEFFGMGALVDKAKDAVATAGAELRASFGSGSGSHTFPETGYSLSGTFYAYWMWNGGLPVFGYPIGDMHEAMNADTGQMHTVQFVERQRFEHHPANAGTAYEVQLGRLGVELLTLQGRDWTTFDKADPSDPHYVMETGHAVAAEFWDYWSGHGLDMGDAGVSMRESVALFGYPISEPAMETNSSGDTVMTQWFERARFEYHPDNAAPYMVLLGRLGAELQEMHDH